MLKKIFKAIYYLVLAAVAIVALFLILSVVPIKGGYKTLVVLSGSMAPDIKMGSVAVVKPSAEYKAGDVITFGEMSKTKTPTTHRIYDIKIIEGEPVYVTKGDANEDPDQKEVSKREIIGKVLFSVPYVGYAVNAAQKPIGFLLIIVIPAVIIIYDEIRKIINEIKKRRENEPV